MRRRDFILSTAFGTAALMAGSTAQAARGAEPRQLSQPWIVRGSESWSFDSKAVGDKFAIAVWRPDVESLTSRGMDAAAPLRVVYVLDGSWALGMAAATAMLQLVDLVKPGFPPLMLVGVDYLEERTNARTRDYTMLDAVPKVIRERMPDKPEYRPGGADRFLQFLEDELDPFIRANYETADGPAGLLGDSFGGTFSFYAFLRQSKLFDRYWLGSPGLFTTGTDYVAQFESLISGDLVHDTHMFLTLGALEMNGGVDFYEDMGRNFNRLVSVLNKQSNERLGWQSKIYSGHTHTSVVAPAMNDALLYLYGPHTP